MSELQFVTNNHPRDVIDGWELDSDERKEFDYIDWTALDRGELSASFIRYKDTLYDLSEFERWDNPSSPTRNSQWDGMRSMSFFSGIVVRYVENYERVIVGSYYTC